MAGRVERIATALQRRIERYYRLEEAPAVVDFLQVRPNETTREAVRLLEADDGVLEIEVIAPELPDPPSLDAYCQLIEGVSHFVYLAERARTGLQTTQLELELQAEVDKFVVLALFREPFDLAHARRLHQRLYERVAFLHPRGTVEGERYRLANDLAARLVRRLEITYASTGRRTELRDTLARFFRMGQKDKIGFARAA